MLSHRETVHFDGYCQTVFASGCTSLRLPPAMYETSCLLAVQSSAFSNSVPMFLLGFLFSLFIYSSLHSGYESFVDFTCHKYLLRGSLLFLLQWCFDEQKFFISMSFSVSNFFIIVNSYYIPRNPILNPLRNLY